MNRISQAAELLLQARLNRQQIAALPPECFPADVQEAYAIQAALVERLLSRSGGRRLGYKIACTNEAAQQFLGLDGPFHGPLLSAIVHSSPAHFAADDFMMRVIEPEFGFEIARDLPPQDVAYSRQQVTEAIGPILPAIEIVESRYQSWTTVGALSLIADHAVHGAWVMGQRSADWHSLDLASHEVKLWVNDTLNQTGNGSVVLGHPLNALTWLVNALCEQGIGLQAGDFVTTGVCIDQVYNAQPGDTVIADFGGLGKVEVSFAQPDL